MAGKGAPDAKRGKTFKQRQTREKVQPVFRAGKHITANWCQVRKNAQLKPRTGKRATANAQLVLGWFLIG